MEFNFDFFFEYDIQSDIFPKMDEDEPSLVSENGSPLSLFFLFDDISKYSENSKISELFIESESSFSSFSNKKNENNKKNKEYINNFKKHNIIKIKNDEKKIRLCDNSIYHNKKKINKNKKVNNKIFYKNIKSNKDLELIKNKININNSNYCNSNKNNQLFSFSMNKIKEKPLFANFALTPFVFLNDDRESRFLNKKHPKF
jgi:hypothetical protein